MHRYRELRKREGRGEKLELITARTKRRGNRKD